MSFIHIHHVNSSHMYYELNDRLLWESEDVEIHSG